MKPQVDTVPLRSSTAGDALVGLLPEGAELLVEVDVARIRDNAKVGPVIAMADKLSLENPLGLKWDLIVGMETIVTGSYRLGRGNAATVTIVRGDRVGQIPNASRLDSRTVVLADAVWVKRVRAIAAGQGHSLLRDRKLLEVRTRAMPDAAQYAAVRVSARLGFRARVALAREFDLEFAPHTVSLWADVVDDFATVLVLEEGTPKRAKELGMAIEAYRDEVASIPIIRLLHLSQALRAMRVDRLGRRVRAVLLIGPSRLEKVVRRVTGRIGKS